MECVLQWLDDLDDLWSTVLLLAEHMRRIVLGVLLVVALLTVSALGAYLAFTNPPLALSAVCLLTVTALYRGTVASRSAAVHS
jgi:hypothetical protein